MQNNDENTKCLLKDKTQPQVDKTITKAVALSVLCSRFWLQALLQVSQRVLPPTRKKRYFLIAEIPYFVKMTHTSAK